MPLEKSRQVLIQSQSLSLCCLDVPHMKDSCMKLPIQYIPHLSPPSQDINNIVLLLCVPVLYKDTRCGFVYSEQVPA